MLVARLLLEERLGVRRARPHRVARVEDGDDNVGRVDHLEELAADPAGLAGVEDVVLGAHRLDGALDVRVELVVVRGGARRRRLRHLAELGRREPRPLPLRAAAKGLGVRLRAQQVDAPLLDVAVLQQPHRQLVAAEEDGVRVRRRLRHLLAEVLQLLLPDDARVPKPPAVGLHARRLHVAHLLADGQPALDDRARLVALHLRAVQVEPVDRRLRAHARRARLRLRRRHALRVRRRVARAPRAVELAGAEGLGHGLRAPRGCRRGRPRAAAWTTFTFSLEREVRAPRCR